MKIFREFLAELKRSNDLKEKEIDFKTMSDMEFEQKYKQRVPLGRRQDPYISTSSYGAHTNSSGWF